MPEVAVKQDLVLRSMGKRGYLLIPDTFQDKFRTTKESLPAPDAYIQTKGNRVRLIYEWNMEELEHAREQ